MRPSVALIALMILPSITSAQAAVPSRLLANDTGKTVLRKVSLGNDIAVAVISSAGTAIIADPVHMPAKIVPEIITITHGHHVNKAYLEEAKSAKIMVQETGSVAVKDIKVKGVAASHSTAPVKYEAPTHVSYLYELDGLRIAYLACNGQERLEPEQVKAFGKVDVVLITMQNEVGVLSIEAAREIIRQLGARVIVPLSHNTGDTEYHLEQMAELVGTKLEMVQGQLALDRKSLASTAPRLIHIAATLAP